MPHVIVSCQSAHSSTDPCSSNFTVWIHLSVHLCGKFSALIMYCFRQSPNVFFSYKSPRYELKSFVEMSVLAYCIRVMSVMSC